jgi:hypothetical protein
VPRASSASANLAMRCCAQCRPHQACSSGAATG